MFFPLGSNISLKANRSSVALTSGRILVPKLEFEGKSVKRAVANACRELNLKAEGLKYKTISHGSSGIFGLVRSRKAKILVTLPTEPPKKKQNDTKLCQMTFYTLVEYTGVTVLNPKYLRFC